MGFRNIKYDIPVGHEGHEYKHTKCLKDPTCDAGGSMISNMTFLCALHIINVMKAMKVMKDKKVMKVMKVIMEVMKIMKVENMI